jgi:hypothetical protein
LIWDGIAGWKIARSSSAKPSSNLPSFELKLTEKVNHLSTLPWGKAVDSPCTSLPVYTGDFWGLEYL